MLGGSDGRMIAQRRATEAKELAVARKQHISTQLEEDKITTLQAKVAEIRDTIQYAEKISGRVVKGWQKLEREGSQLTPGANRNEEKEKLASNVAEHVREATGGGGWGLNHPKLKGLAILKFPLTHVVGCLCSCARFPFFFFIFAFIQFAFTLFRLFSDVCVRVGRLVCVASRVAVMFVTRPSSLVVRRFCRSVRLLLHLRLRHVFLRFLSCRHQRYIIVKSTTQSDVDEINERMGRLNSKWEDFVGDFSHMLDWIPDVNIDWFVDWLPGVDLPGFTLRIQSINLGFVAAFNGFLELVSGLAKVFDLNWVPVAATACEGALAPGKLLTTSLVVVVLVFLFDSKVGSSESQIAMARDIHRITTTNLTSR